MNFYTQATIANRVMPGVEFVHVIKEYPLWEDAYRYTLNNTVATHDYYYRLRGEKDLINQDLVNDRKTLVQTAIEESLGLYQKADLTLCSLSDEERFGCLRWVILGKSATKSHAPSNSDRFTSIQVSYYVNEKEAENDVLNIMIILTGSSLRRNIIPFNGIGSEFDLAELMESLEPKVNQKVQLESNPIERIRYSMTFIRKHHQEIFQLTLDIKKQIFDTIRFRAVDLRDFSNYIELARVSKEEALKIDAIPNLRFGQRTWPGFVGEQRYQLEFAAIKGEYLRGFLTAFEYIKVNNLLSPEIKYGSNKLFPDKWIENYSVIISEIEFKPKVQAIRVHFRANCAPGEEEERGGRTSLGRHLCIIIDKETFTPILGSLGRD